MLYFGSPKGISSTETQVNVGEAASPTLLLPGAHSQACPDLAVMFLTMWPLGCWRALCTCLEAHLWNSGRSQLCVPEPRPGWAGLEQVLGLSYGCCLPRSI